MKDNKAMKYITSLISGFGYGQVGKLPSGCSCSLTTVIFVYPISFRVRVTGFKPLPFNGLYTIAIFLSTSSPNKTDWLFTCSINAVNTSS